MSPAPQSDRQHVSTDAVRAGALTRSRDAQCVICGFVHEVALTVLRWRAFQHAQMLEIERGENIDVVDE